MTPLLQPLAWFKRHRATYAVLVSVGCTYYMDKTQTWLVEIAGAAGVQTTEGSSVSPYTGDAGGATSLSSTNGGNATKSGTWFSPPIGARSGVLGGFGAVGPGGDTSKSENGGNGFTAAGASGFSGALDKAGGSGYADASLVSSGGTEGNSSATPSESVAGQTGLAGGGAAGMSADSFCGNLMDLKSIARELSFDVLTIDCLILSDLTFEQRDTIHARVLEVRNQGISSQGEFCLFLGEPSLWLEATERIVISGPISLRGKDGKPSQDFGDSCNGGGQDGGSLSMKAPNIQIDSLVDLRGGNSVLSLVTNVEWAMDGGNGGNLTLLADQLVTLSNRASIILSGGEPSKLASGVVGAGRIGAAGTLSILTPVLYDWTADPWNQSNDGQPVLGGSTQIQGNAGNASSGSLCIEYPDESLDCIEDLYRLEGTSTHSELKVTLASVADDAGLDLFVFRVDDQGATIWDASATTDNVESIEATLDTSGQFLIAVNRISEPGESEAVGYSLSIELE